MNPLLRPVNLHTAAAFDKATEITRCLLTSNDADEIADAMETAASDSDVAHAVLMRVTCVARGWETLDAQPTGVEMVADALRPSGQLIVPRSLS